MPSIKDKRQQKKNKGISLRAGSIYSRDASRNTPIDGTATEVQIQNMWQERFGLFLNPSQRIENYINDLNGWKIIKNFTVDGQYTAFYVKHPEFTLSFYEKMEPCDNFSEHWHLKNKKVGCHKLGLIEVRFKYHQTILKTLELINVEYKVSFPVPDYIKPTNVFNNPKARIAKNSLAFKIAAIWNISHEGDDSDWLQRYKEGLNNFLRLYSDEFAIEIGE